MKKLINENDFKWYKSGLDVLGQTEFDHRGMPEEYPCYVESEFISGYSYNYCEIDQYEHSFYYQEEVKCSHCGHNEKKWPERIIHPELYEKIK